jgi:hypothetical protein
VSTTLQRGLLRDTRRCSLPEVDSFKTVEQLSDQQTPFTLGKVLNLENAPCGCNGGSGAAGTHSLRSWLELPDLYSESR